MNEELTKQLNEKYPEIFLFHNFRSVDHFCFECDDGWYNILNVLFAQITDLVRQNNKKYNKITEATDMIDNGQREHVPPYLLNQIEALNNGNGEWPVEMEFPTVQQVKEKFGTLRVYVDAYDDRIQDLIGFAEAMSAVTCEKCGNVGEARSMGWVKVLCDKHSELRRQEVQKRVEDRNAADEAREKEL